MTYTNAFGRERQPFYMLGREFYFQFIPSIHFQEIMRHVLEMLLSLNMIETTLPTMESENLHPNPADKGVSQYMPLLAKMRILLEEKVYQILFDILLYQNNERIELDILKHKTSPMEIAQFLTLLLGDDEIVKALEVVISGLGKIIDTLTHAPLATPNFTHSS